MNPLYLVISTGGRNASGDPQLMWFADYGGARAEVKRRLGVAKLHDSARGRRRRYPIAFIRVHDGIAWEAEWAEDYAAVTASHADFDKSGGVAVYEMLPAGTGEGYQVRP